jgi:hypothetical protein
LLLVGAAPTGDEDIYTQAPNPNAGHEEEVIPPPVSDEEPGVPPNLSVVTEGNPANGHVLVKRTTAEGHTCQERDNQPTRKSLVPNQSLTWAKRNPHWRRPAKRR